MRVQHTSPRSDSDRDGWCFVNRFWTIRTRFLVFGILSLIPLLGFSWLLVSNHNTTRYQDLVQSQTVMSSQISGSLVGYLGGSYRSLEGLASTAMFVEGAEPEAITSVLGQTRTIRPDFVGVFVLDSNGDQIAQAGIVDTTVLPEISSQIDGVLGSGQRAVTGRVDLPLDPPSSVFVLLVPIVSVPETTNGNNNDVATPEAGPNIDESNENEQEETQSPGTVRGVIGAIIQTDTLNQVALPSVRGRTEFVIIADTQIITSSSDARANEEAFLDNLLAQNSAISEEGTDVFRMTSLSGTERTAVWTPLPLDSTNWTILISTPVPESQINSLWQQLLALFLVAALVYLVISYSFGELTSRSLSDLTESAKRLAEGDYKTPVATRGSGEFAELRESLVSLRERTEIIMSSAEERQEERQRQNEELRDLLRRDLRMQEDERRHIASEIHDAVSPLITGALYQSRALQRANGDTTPDLVESSLEDVNNLLERASQELHGIIFDLRPPDLDDLGVVAAIEAFVSTIQRTGLEARLEVIDEPPPLTPEVRLGIYRIVQEALHNVLRHANADEAVVRMEYVNQLLRVTIRDNGAGFDPEGARRPTSLGLLSMRERAAAIDADFEILSRPGGGTVIIVERRDTGSGMSDELLETILRGRSKANVEAETDSDPEATDHDPGSGADASR